MRQHQSITVVLEDGTEITLPTIMAVCPRCEGRGTHVNPSIDGNGITADEMAELGDDFREDYMSGVYDVPCERCHGANVIPVVNREACTPEALAAYDAEQRAEAEYRAECRSEARAFGYDY